MSSLHNSRIGDDFWPVYYPSIYSGPLSLAIPPWLGATMVLAICGRSSASEVTTLCCFI